jgi:hypothetical protein
VGQWVHEAQGYMAVAQCVDGHTEVEDQHGTIWLVVVDEDTHHVSLPLTSVWVMVPVSDTTKYDDYLDCQHHLNQW